MSFMKLRHIADIQNSNVDKIISETEIPVRLCNYVDVYKSDFITLAINFNAGSATAEEISRFAVKVGDVIITKDSEDRHDIGIPAYVAETAKDLVCGYHLTMLRAFKYRAEGAFLFWALQSKKAKEDFAIAAKGVTRYGLTQEGIKGLELWLPDLITQKRIAAFLDRETALIDELIAKKERLVKVLREGLLSELERLVTPEEPIHEQMIPFRWVCRITEGQVDPTAPEWASKPLIAPNHIESRTGRLIEIETAEDQGAISGKYAFPSGTVLYSKIRPNLAKACVATVEGMCSADMYPVLPDRRLRPQFLLMQLLSEKFTDWATLESMRVAMPKINRETLGSYRLWVPEVDVQEAAAATFFAAQSRNEALSDKVIGSVDRLREYRAALITAAVTGQIDVDTYGKSSATSATLDRIEEEMQA